MRFFTSTIALIQAIFLPMTVLAADQYRLGTITSAVSVNSIPPNVNSFQSPQNKNALFAGRNISAGERINPGDLIDGQGDIAEASAFIGLEARRSIYHGQPVTITNFREPIMVKRNSIVRMEYMTGSLKITTEGRSLDQGGTGDLVRVMNLGSRQTVTARIVGPDAVKVGQ
ncbi:MAG: flagellar basal body P-ring formation chaperone FlgA [Pseudomonadota bacterium]